MARLKFLSIPKMAPAITAIVMMLINISFAVTNDRESFGLQPLLKRAMVQAHDGNNFGTSSVSPAHAATGFSSTDNASAGGMHGKWANGLDGKPKDLKEYHASQRALYESPPAPSSNTDKHGRSLRTRYSDQGPIGPVSSNTASPSLSPSPSPAPAPAPRQGFERFPDEPYPPPSKGGSGRKLSGSKKSRLRVKVGPTNKRSFEVEETEIMVKRSHRESFDMQPMIKRAMVQAHSGNNAGSSSINVAHSATGSSSFDHASAGGMHDKWPNGLDGKPKDLKAYHASQRAMYERPVIPTEPIPYTPKHSRISPSSSPSPSPAPSPGPASSQKSHGRSLRPRYSDQGDIKPTNGPPVGGSMGSYPPSPAHGRDRWADDGWKTSGSPASAPSSKNGRPRMPDEPWPSATAPPPAKGGSGRKLLGSRKSRLREKSGSMNKREFTVEETNTMAKRSVVPASGSAAGGSGGVAAYSGTNAHSTSQSGNYGTWANGESGRPIHPKERVLFHPYVQAPSPYQIGGGSSGSIPDFKNHAPSPSPASSPAPSPSGRRLLAEKPSKKCRLRGKC